MDDTSNLDAPVKVETAEAAPAPDKISDVAAVSESALALAEELHLLNAKLVERGSSVIECIALIARVFKGHRV